MRADSQNNICEVLAITTVLIALSSAFYLLVSQKALQDLRNIAPTSIFNIRPPPQESSSNGLTVKEFFPVRSANENASVYEEELLSLTNGFLMVQESEGLPRQYGVSMFHQLHCVAMVRAKLFGSDMHHHSHHPESTAGVEVGGTAQMENKDQDREEMEHLAHCLDYFAQVHILVFRFPSTVFFSCDQFSHRFSIRSDLLESFADCYLPKRRESCALPTTRSKPLRRFCTMTRVSRRELSVAKEWSTSVATQETCWKLS